MASVIWRRSPTVLRVPAWLRKGEPRISLGISLTRRSLYNRSGSSSNNEQEPINVCVRRYTWDPGINSCCKKIFTQFGNLLNFERKKSQVLSENTYISSTVLYVAIQTWHIVHLNAGSGHAVRTPRLGPPADRTQPGKTTWGKNVWKVFYEVWLSKKKEWSA